MPEENAMRPDDHKPGATRRRFLADAVRLAGGLGFVSVVAIEPARATPAKMQAAMKKVLGEAPLRAGMVGGEELHIRADLRLRPDRDRRAVEEDATGVHEHLVARSTFAP